MYHNDRPDIIESNDIAGLLHLSTSHLADDRVILHADFVLDTSRKNYASPEKLQFHVTDGVTHSLLRPETTSPDWVEPASYVLTSEGEDDSTTEEDEDPSEIRETLAVRRSRVATHIAPEEEITAGAESAPEENDEDTSV